MMIEDWLMSYDYDPDAEPATVVVEMLPNRYVRVNREVHYLTKHVTTDAAGRKVRKWSVGPKGRFKVPPRVAAKLTEQRDDGNPVVMPMARIVEDARQKRREVAT